MKKIIDAHIHLDQYKNEEIQKIIEQSKEIQCTHLIAVSTDLESSWKTQELSNAYSHVTPAFGFHPEQPLPTDSQLSDFFKWLGKNINQMVAIGEVGLPYYLRLESTTPFPQEGYIELLDQFLLKAKAWHKPVLLHAVYEDASVVCDLLEKHAIEKAHFHWFKGDTSTIERMIENGYYISVTPDVVYEEEIQTIAKHYPLNQLMVETDGPWPFEKQFRDQMTHPWMIHKSIETIAHLKDLPLDEVYRSIYENSLRFFNLTSAPLA